MNYELTGRAWVFGDSIDTDAMYPGFAMKLPIPEAARHVFYDLRPGWTDDARPGDIVVAGRNFGIGSSRPVAALMRHLGVAALVAEEFNSLFLRNAINNGLPALTVPGVRDLVSEGDEITIHLAEGWLAAEQPAHRGSAAAPDGAGHPRRRRPPSPAGRRRLPAPSGTRRTTA